MFRIVYAALFALALKIYGFLLRIYPPEFRAGYGWQIVQAFRAGCRDAYHKDGPIGLVCWYLFSLADLVTSVIREQIAERAERRRIVAHDQSRLQLGGNSLQLLLSGELLTAKSTPPHNWSLPLVALVGVLWGALVQLNREYGPAVPIGNNFIWLHAICLGLLLLLIALRQPGINPTRLGVLLALFCTCVLVGHYGYYAVTLGLAHGSPMRTYMDMGEWSSYDFLINMFSGLVSQHILFVQVGGFGLGWLWGLLLQSVRNLRRPATA